ncbi:MAG TPA: FKBP-type peptidyl-prolyl cis-trans isomerase [Solirubrobacteraceae bacterium]|nr:FKBP-type peptidyl-prolyl cis-trans isomerase [Solirubrobacteraceae bacterium]
MTNFSDVTNRLYLRPRAATARRIVLGLGALGAAALIAGCGSGGGSSTITVGNENKADEALINKSASTGTTGPSTTATAKTPTSGPLSKEPHITPPSGPPPTKLVTKEIVKGTGAEAKTGSAVSVNYVGALYKTGKVFDASWKRNEPFSFTLGKGQVIPGWEQGVVGMKVGGRRELIIPAALGYGAKGSPPSIPPNETLIFIVDLLSA